MTLRGSYRFSIPSACSTFSIVTCAGETVLNFSS